MSNIMQIIGLVAGLLALLVSLIAFLKANGLSSRIEELEDQFEELTHNSSSSGSRKKKKRSRD